MATARAVAPLDLAVEQSCVFHGGMRYPSCRLVLERGPCTTSRAVDLKLKLTSIECTSGTVILDLFDEECTEQVSHRHQLPRLDEMRADDLEKYQVCETVRAVVGKDVQVLG